MFFIEKLWRGEIRPCQKAIRKDSEYHKILHSINGAVSAFTENLDENEKIRFREIEEAQEKLCGIEVKETFFEGFRLGVGLILDAVGEYKSQLCSFGEEE